MPFVFAVLSSVSYSMIEFSSAIMIHPVILQKTLFDQVSSRVRHNWRLETTLSYVNRVNFDCSRSLTSTKHQIGKIESWTFNSILDKESLKLTLQCMSMEYLYTLDSLWVKIIAENLIGRVVSISFGAVIKCPPKSRFVYGILIRPSLTEYELWVQDDKVRQAR